LPETLRAKTG